MVSIIITTCKEGARFKKALKRIQEEAAKLKEETEILVAAPDLESRKIAERLKREKPSPALFFLQDQAEGKPAALNLALRKARGDILIFTDGDVHIGRDSLKYLLLEFKNKDVGAVSGRPVSLNQRHNIFGFWAYSLVESAHQMRQVRFNKEESFPCSGYLYGLHNFWKGSFQLPPSLLAEDAYLSQLICRKGKKIAYAERAKVYVKYADNLSDWIKQKKRTLAGSAQLKFFFKKDQKTKGFQRSFRDELQGIGKIFSYAQNNKEILWTFGLIFARLYVWILVFWQMKISKRPLEKLWVRVESTK